MVRERCYSRCTQKVSCHEILHTAQECDYGKNVDTSKINLPFTGKKATILYPTDLGISVSISGKTIEFKLLHKYMAVIL